MARSRKAITAGTVFRRDGFTRHSSAADQICHTNEQTCTRQIGSFTQVIVHCANQILSAVCYTIYSGRQPTAFGIYTQYVGRCTNQPGLVGHTVSQPGEMKKIRSTQDLFSFVRLSSFCGAWSPSLTCGAMLPSSLSPNQ